MSRNGGRGYRGRPLLAMGGRSAISRLRLSSALSRRLWLSFAEPPRMQFLVRPRVGSRLLANRMVLGRLSDFIRSKVSALGVPASNRTLCVALLVCCLTFPSNFSLHIVHKAVWLWAF